MSHSLAKWLRLAALCACIGLGSLSWSFKTTATTISNDFSGQLTSQHDTWNRMTTINVLSGQQVFFETTHVRIQTNGTYTINVTATGFTPAINVYGGVFFPDQPQVNFWDNGVVGSRQDVFLAGGQQFDIVISTSLAGQTGAYTASISGPGPITIDPPPPLGILSNPLDATITPGQTATLRVSTQGRPPKNHQWFQGQSGDTSNPIAGATNASFTTPPLFADTSYWVRVSDANTTVNSGTATVFVTNGPIGYSSALTPCDDRFNRLVPRNGPGDPIQLSGQNVSYKVFRFRVSTPGSYRFQLNTSGFNGVLFLYQGVFLPNDARVNFFGNSPVGASVNLTSTLLADSNVMHLVIASLTPSNLGTFSLTVSGPAFVTKLPAPVLTTPLQNVSITRGQLASFNVGTSSSNVSFQWFKGCSNRTLIPGEVAASYTTSPQTRDDTYTVRLENPGGYEVSSATVTILPTAGDVNADAIVQNTSLSQIAPGLLRTATAGDGRTLTAQKVTDPAHGTVSLNSLGGFTYQPAANYAGPDSFTYRAFDGVNVSNTATVNLAVVPVFASNTPITIPSSGPASMYPSIINVSGLNGTISRVRVRLDRLHHENQGDLDILLVGPQGQSLVLMSDANGDPDNPFLFDRVLTFEDAAPQTIPDGQALFDGTYRPVNYGGGDSFPSPAPATFSSPAPAGTATLASVFNGTDPNGAWKLFIFDDQGFSSGSLPGWSLTIFTGAGCPRFTITPASLPEAVLNTPFTTTTLESSGGTGIYTFRITSGALPNGITLTTTGVLSGTPTVPGIFNFTVTATDQNGCTWQRAYALNVACPLITIVPQTLPAATIGQNYNAALQSSGSPGPYTFSKLAGNLPNGVALNPNGTLSGTPMQSGFFAFTVQALDANGCTGTQDMTLQVNCQSITVNAPANNTGVIGEPFSAAFTQIGGASTTLFTTSSTLPTGVTLVGNGSLSGTPTETGSFPIIVKATDINGCTGTVGFTLTVACPQVSISPARLPAATRGVTYSQALTAANTVGATGFTATPGSLPAGLTLSSAGLLSGAPTQAGSLTFTVTVTDSRGCGGSQSYTLVVNCPTLNLSPASLPNSQAGIAYTQQLTANGVAPHSFTVIGGNLPNGLTLAANGALTGTPGAAGNFSFTIKATDAQGCQGTQSYSINITCPAITMAALPSATAGVNYNVNLIASPTNTNYSFAVAAESILPPGLSLINGGISGIPTQAGTFTFNIVVTGFGGTCAQTLPITLVVNCPTIAIAPVALPDGQFGAVYNASLSASPAGGAYSFAVTNGALPPGLTLQSNGSLTGTPAANGVFNFRVTVTGFGGQCGGFRDYQLLISGCAAITVNPASLPNGAIGTNYSAAISASPSGSYQFAVASGALPAGLSLNSATGAITGSPTLPGTFSFRIAASGGGCSGFRDYTVVISCQAITLGTSLPNGTATIAYNQTINVTPTAVYSFSLISGSLPSGLTLNSGTGLISGLPLATGTFNFTIKAMTANGCSGTQSYSITINCPAIALSSLPTPTLGVAYNQTVTAAPAGGNYSFALASGALPPGLTLNGATGLVTGTPSTSGTFNFTITASSAGGFGACTGNRTYLMTIEGSGCPAITMTELPGGMPGQLYNSPVTASPGGSYSYAVTAGSLPPGLSLFGSFGLIFGFPTIAGNFSFTITATDANNCTGSKQFTLAIGGAGLKALVFGDFDGDGKADLSVWRGQAGNWMTLRSKDGRLQSEQWGSSSAPYNDVMAPGDYDGDGKMDLAVFRRGGQTQSRQQGAEWLIKCSRDGTVLSKLWGLATDIPVPGDYDGDGKTDIAVWRGAETNWYILRSSDNQMQIVSWGSSNTPYRDLPVPADYDGDGKTDIAVFRQASGKEPAHWYIRFSSDGSVIDKAWGQGSDVPVAADYDGDGKADIAVWRGSDTNWYVLRSSDDTSRTIPWGASSLGDVPVPGDYDGDGKADIAIWRAPEGRWYVLRSSDGAVLIRQHGQGGDTPTTMIRK